MDINTHQLEAIQEGVSKIQRNKHNREQWEAAVVEMRTKYADLLNAEDDGTMPEVVGQLIGAIQEFENS